MSARTLQFVKRVTDLGRRAYELLTESVSNGKTLNPAKTHYYPQIDSCQIDTLWFLYGHFLGERETGTFVEIGAYDGLFVSNSWGLATRNWTGLLVEPVPYLAEKCRQNYANRPNVRVVQSAVAEPGTESITLHLAGTLSTASADVASAYMQLDWAHNLVSGDVLEVAALTLDQLLIEENFNPGFDVLIIDVEGYEAAVFSGFDLPRWRPKMIIIELADTHPDLASISERDVQLSRGIEQHEYAVIYKDLVNTVFVRRDIQDDSYSQARHREP